MANVYFLSVYLLIIREIIKMKRICSAVVWGLILVFAFVAVPNAQEDVVDKITIKAIRKIEVDKSNNKMLVTVVINNANDKGLQFRKGDFAFHMGAKVHPDPALSRYADIPEAELGKQADHNSDENTVRNSSIKSEDRGIILPDNENSEVDFEIELGPDGFGVLAHIMNCIGNPSVRASYIRISGEFELAMKSSKGWTSARDLKIDWIFRPSIPDKVNFMTAQ